jgi:hypothetical protein
MDEMTASGRESLRVGASAFRAAVAALEHERAGAEPSVRRIAEALERLARIYRADSVEAAARRLAGSPAEGLREAIPPLLEALEELAPSSPTPASHRTPAETRS